MMVSFEKVFNSEETRKLYEKIRAKAIEEHWCSTCRHCKDEPDGLWCKFWNSVAETSCLIYDLDPTKV